MSLKFQRFIQKYIQNHWRERDSKLIFQKTSNVLWSDVQNNSILEIPPSLPKKSYYFHKNHTHTHIRKVFYVHITHTVSKDNQMVNFCQTVGGNNCVVLFAHHKIQEPFIIHLSSTMLAQEGNKFPMVSDTKCFTFFPFIGMFFYLHDKYLYILSLKMSWIQHDSAHFKCSQSA